MTTLKEFADSVRAEDWLVKGYEAIASALAHPFSDFYCWLSLHFARIVIDMFRPDGIFYRVKYEDRANNH